MAGGWWIFPRKNPGCIDFLQSIGGTKQEATALLKDTRCGEESRSDFGIRERNGGTLFLFVLPGFSIGRMNDL